MRRQELLGLLLAKLTTRARQQDRDKRRKTITGQYSFTRVYSSSSLRVIYTEVRAPKRDSVVETVDLRLLRLSLPPHKLASCSRVASSCTSCLLLLLTTTPSQQSTSYSSTATTTCPANYSTSCSHTSHTPLPTRPRFPPPLSSTNSPPPRLHNLKPEDSYHEVSTS